MNSKVEQFYKQCKLTVTSYKEQMITGNYVCGCETIGAPAELEPEPLVKAVTWQELEKSFKAQRHLPRSERLNSIEEHLAAIVNAREGRSMTYSSEKLREAYLDLERAMSTIRKPQIR
jgi:hypothetical protein